MSFTALCLCFILGEAGRVRWMPLHHITPTSRYSPARPMATCLPACVDGYIHAFIHCPVTDPVTICPIFFRVCHRLLALCIHFLAAVCYDRCGVVRCGRLTDWCTQPTPLPCHASDTYINGRAVGPTPECASGHDSPPVHTHAHTRYYLPA